MLLFNNWQRSWKNAKCSRCYSAIVWCYFTIVSMYCLSLQLYCVGLIGRLSFTHTESILGVFFQFTWHSNLHVLSGHSTTHIAEYEDSKKRPQNLSYWDGISECDILVVIGKNVGNTISQHYIFLCITTDFKTLIRSSFNWKRIKHAQTWCCVERCSFSPHCRFVWK